MWKDIGLFLVGLTLLIAGAQLLVRGSSRLALALGIAPLIVGLTVVAFGTSAPELAVSIQSCLDDQSAIVLGNVVGSNIYNVLFILGMCATIIPLAVAPQLIRWDVPVMIFSAFALLLLGKDGNIRRLDGVVLLLLFVVYLIFTVIQSHRESKQVKADYAKQMNDIPIDRRYWLHSLFILAGLTLLGVGSDILVTSAVTIAKDWGVSEVIIGMTVVTIGTTAPELSACLIAAWNGEGDIAVGNIVGSNLFNILCVLGVGSVISPGGITVGPRMVSFGIPVMTAVCFACLPVFFAGRAIRRWEGIIFLLFFGLYILDLVLEELRDERVLTLQNAILWFVGPLTLMTIVVSVWREFKSVGK